MNEENKMQEIMNRIKNRRIQLSLSYQELADKTGLSKSTLQRYETGAIKNMPLDKLEVLSKALDIDPSYLMGWENENTHNSNLSNEENIILEHYNKLDNEDKHKVVDYAKLLHNQDKYNTAPETDITSIDDEFTIAKKRAIAARKKKEQYYKDNSHLIPKASHDKEGNFSAEDIKHDDDLMLNDDLWND